MEFICNVLLLMKISKCCKTTKHTINIKTNNSNTTIVKTSTRAGKWPCKNITDALNRARKGLFEKKSLKDIQCWEILLKSSFLGLCSKSFWSDYSLFIVYSFYRDSVIPCFKCWVYFVTSGGDGHLQAINYFKELTCTDLNFLFFSYSLQRICVGSLRRSQKHIGIIIKKIKNECLKIKEGRGVKGGK